MSFILNAIKVFFLFLAECILDIGRLLYSFIITLANTNFFTQEVLEKFAGRVYVLLGIFMLFKVSFSLVNYIVNPEDFTDKEKGIGKLVPNIMITLVLIVFTPRIFAEAMDLQHLLIKEEFLEKIIIGDTGVSESINMREEGSGDTIALAIFNSFYKINDRSSLPSTADNLYLNCSNNNTDCRYSSYGDAFGSFSNYNAYDGIWDGTAEYHEFLAIIAAVIFVLVMIQFCFDIALRTVKLGFLQLISPIPIMSRIDPKSAKNGMFSKWLKMSLKTYADLFIRLAALDFAVVLIGVIMDTWKDNISDMGSFVRVFLILGTLMFAKQLPKLIEDLFGFKLDGGFTLNPMKRLKDVPGSHIASAGLAGAVGGIAGMGTNLYAGIKAKDGVGKTIRSAFAGSASSLFRSGYSGLKDNKNKPFKAVGAGIKGSVSARNLRDEREIAGDNGIHGMVRRAGVAINNFSGITSGAEKYEKELSAYDTALSKQAAIDKLIESEIEKGKSSRTTTFTYTDVNGNKQTVTNANVNVLKQRIEQLKNSGANPEDIQNAEYAYKAALKQAKIDYVNKSFDLVNPKDRNSIEIKETTMDKHIATQVRHMIEEMDYYSKQNSSYDGFKDVQGIANNITRDDKGNIEINIGETWDKFKGTIHGAKDNVTISKTYRQAMANKKLDNKK